MWKELSGTMPKTCRQRQEAQDLLKLAFVLAFRPLAFAPGLPPGGLRLLGKWAADSGRKLNWNGEGRSRSVRCRMRRKAGVGKVRRRAVRSGCSRHGPELANCGGAQGRKNGTDDRRCENLDAAARCHPSVSATPNARSRCAMTSAAVGTRPETRRPKTAAQVCISRLLTWETEGWEGRKA